MLLGRVLIDTDHVSNEGRYSSENLVCARTQYFSLVAMLDSPQPGISSLFLWPNPKAEGGHLAAYCFTMCAEDGLWCSMLRAVQPE